MCIENTNLPQTAVKRQKDLTLIEGRKLKLNIFFHKLSFVDQKSDKGFIIFWHKMVCFFKSRLTGKDERRKRESEIKI